MHLVKNNNHQSWAAIQKTDTEHWQQCEQPKLLVQLILLEMCT